MGNSPKRRVEVEEDWDNTRWPAVLVVFLFFVDDIFELKSLSFLWKVFSSPNAICLVLAFVAFLAFHRCLQVSLQKKRYIVWKNSPKAVSVYQHYIYYYIDILL